VGWQGRPEAPAPRTLPDGREPTRALAPDSRLIRAAGGDPEATRRIPPDSDLLRLVRGELVDTRPVRPSSSLLAATRARDPEDPVASALPGAAPRPAPDAPDGLETAFYLDAALRRTRSRIWLLMLADVCLVLVGGYLFVSWLRAADRRSPGPGASAGPTRQARFVDWDGEGNIATGPVEVRFGPASAPEPDAGPPRPVAGAPDARAPRLRPDAAVARAVDAGGNRRLDAAVVRTLDAAAAPSRPDEAAARARLEAARRAFLAAVPERIRVRQPDVKRCYQATLQVMPKVAGDLDLTFVVGAAGTVQQVTTSRNTTGSKALASCIEAVFRDLQFPRPPEPAVTLRYPFRFARKN
jgi:hypothetical protein